MVTILNLPVLIKEQYFCTSHHVLAPYTEGTISKSFSGSIYCHPYDDSTKKACEQKELCSVTQTETALPPTLKTCILKFNSFISLLNPPAHL